jgi:hypothetical protein
VEDPTALAALSSQPVIHLNLSKKIWQHSNSSSSSTTQPQIHLFIAFLASSLMPDHYHDLVEEVLTLHEDSLTWTVKEIFLEVATSLDDDSQQEINLCETIGHRARQLLKDF